jgi:transposase-like protein
MGYSDPPGGSMTQDILFKKSPYAGYAAGVKQQIIDMAMNASGIRDTARVLHVSPTTVIKELKKKSRSCSQ